jgi:hypothetical protein
LHVLPSLPAFDWAGSSAHSKATATVVALLTIGAIWFWLWAQKHVEDFKQRIGRGSWILRDRPRYFREVASWQFLSWVCRIASLYWFLRAFHVHATLHNALLAQVVDSLSTLLPFSPGGAGTKQGCWSTSCTARRRARACWRSASAVRGRDDLQRRDRRDRDLLELRTLRLREVLGGHAPPRARPSRPASYALSSASSSGCSSSAPALVTSVA